jgi:cytochrome c553
MKRNILALLAVCSLGAATAAFGAAARGDGVVGGPHDMTTYGYVDNQARVCAFCHTPHHAAQTGGEYLPLWSRAEDTKPFNVAYNSSTINASALQEATTDKAIGPTRLCMSCHDGTIAPDQHYGASAGATALTGDNFSLVGNGAGVGSGAAGLTNDHPVGFDYVAVAIGPETGIAPDLATLQAAANDPNADAWIRNPNARFLDNTQQLKISDRLYVAANGSAYMTCATCHDVHNKKNVYPGVEPINYLVLAPQAGSKLCLSCHIK